MSLAAYRPEIDGLRAVAVLAVIAFHLAPKTLAGGYLGVDMFFVLSGFLITSIIWSQMQSGSFKLAEFYERRIRRILPALMTMLVVVTIFAVVLLLPADLTGYGRSLLAVLAFVPNIYFWRDTNYFARAAEEKPLLHTWSLGVEEQFYVLFPLLLMVLVRKGTRVAFVSVAALTKASLGANIWLNKIGGSSPAFFLLPSRTWELGAGALVALWPRADIARHWSAPGIALVGAAFALAALANVYPLGAALPAAIPAVLGTSMLVSARGGGQGSPVFQVLTSRPAVFFGKISYALYLWHWPVIVFGRYYLVRDFSIGEGLAAFVLAVALALVTWRFVEQPCRRRLPFPWVGGTVLAAGLAAGLAGFILISSNGMPNRLPVEAAAINAAVGTNYRCPVQNYLVFGGSRACTLNLATRDPSQSKVILFGNSHAQMYAPAVETILQRNGEPGLLVPMNGCLPTIITNINETCRKLASVGLAEILKLPRADTIILGLTWRHERLTDERGNSIPPDQVDSALVAGLDDVVQRITASGKRVVVIGPIAYPGWDIASVLSRQRAFGWHVSEPDSVPQTQFLAREGHFIDHFSTTPGVRFVPAHRVQCDGAACHYLIDGKSLFADASHLASAELDRYLPLFSAALGVRN